MLDFASFSQLTECEWFNQPVLQKLRALHRDVAAVYEWEGSHITIKQKTSNQNINIFKL